MEALEKIFERYSIVLFVTKVQTWTKYLRKTLVFMSNSAKNFHVKF